MWTRLSILHSDSEERSSLDLPKHFLWQTCMRNVYVSDLCLLSQDLTKIQLPQYRLYQGYGAYAFLLEMVLGLHSSLLGETEVFHQFRKVFIGASTNSPVLDSFLKKLCMDITQDARAIRSKYMRGLGEISYGGVARRLLRKKAPWQVSLLGSGQLACQLIPWLLKDRHSIRVFGRNSRQLKKIKEKFSVSTAHYKELHEKPLPSHSAILIAAPLALNPYAFLFKKGMYILDFRGEVFLEELEIPPDLSYYSLKEIASFISESQMKREALLCKLRPEIEKQITLRKSESYQSSYDWEELSSRCVV